MKISTTMDLSSSKVHVCIQRRFFRGTYEAIISPTFQERACHALQTNTLHAKIISVLEHALDHVQSAMLASVADVEIRIRRNLRITKGTTDGETLSTRGDTASFLFTVDSLHHFLLKKFQQGSTNVLRHTHSHK